MTPDSEAKLTRETPFHPRTSALTRNFTEYRGYWLPTKFNNHGAGGRVFRLPRRRPW